MRYLQFFLILFFFSGCIFAQNSISVNARLIDSTRTLEVDQKIRFINTENRELVSIYLNDWNNAFSTKSSDLAKRFAEDYSRRFHFAKLEERGHTRIHSIQDSLNGEYEWDRPGEVPDLIRIRLEKPLPAGDSIELKLNYSLRIPDDKFTRFGKDQQGNYKLRYWYIVPAPLDNGWKLYSHKDLGLQYVKPYNIDISLDIPTQFYAASGLDLIKTTTNLNSKKITFKGTDRIDGTMYLTKSYIFESIKTDSKQVITNIEDEDIQLDLKNALLERVVGFLQERLGDYPHKNLFVTQEDYLKNPIYGLNQLPSFIRPFPDGFQYDIKLFKTLSDYYLHNTIMVNPRTEKWVTDAIMISLMMDYVDTYYPNMKLVGKLGDVIGLKWFHAADLKFNDQYQFLYMNMARMNLDQPLITSQDSLVKFNENIANAYKAGIGIKYLEDFIGQEPVKRSISEFYSEYKLKPVTDEDFIASLKQNSEKNIDWFFEDYVGTSSKIDYKISHVKAEGDSLKVTIKNRLSGKMPISLYGLNEGNVTYKTWVEQVKDTKSIYIPKQDIQRLALNYESKVPEVNQRNNYKAVTKFLNKPIQFRLLQDVEDPKYHQIFFMPEFEYNLYDGISIGPKLYNKTILSKTFNFAISPKYGFNSETFVGSASFVNTHQFENKELYAISYGMAGTRFSYGYDLFYEKFTPFLTFNFRNAYLRSNERQRLLIRNVNVKRDQNPDSPLLQPDYNVFNINYRYSNPNFIKYFSGGIDYQLSDKFSKISFSAEYRKLFKNNRQINLRFFSGAFIYNDVSTNDYFSFALDRPTDYLFDYNYYGRSQGSGLFSQQIIVAEGGFKSQLQPEFANDWLMSLNGSTNIWNWIYAYGDVGLVKNKGSNAELLYDSGIRVSLVQDYFELFFPVYSNLGWEIDEPDYDQRIRFIVALDINTLIRLFTRRWY
ncbi:metalloprotease [Christiangramia salexigens]|uniref:Metalloprotease n=1 Tax=Christiangramia salexigens TaxID=1913577 RepID=A0A1L3J2A0_9FLAO|nr:metalloprotease [Christiangramia salexigens]APG59240.1 metalloprotease [Christiangramia salexigens]